MVSQEEVPQVLLVDDEAGMREMLTAAMEAEGWRVTATADPLEALELIHARPFDLVLSDIRMPGLTGIELLKAVREADPDAVVVLITGYASLDTAVRALRYGAYDYISKPFDSIESVLRVLRRGIEQRRLRRRNAELIAHLQEANRENLRLLNQIRAMNRELEEKVRERTRELEQAYQELQALEQIRSEFLAHLSDEFFTPLNQIIGFAGLLREGMAGPLTDGQVRFVSHILDAGQRLKDLLETLLDLSRLQAGHVAFDPRPVDLSALLDGVMKFFESELRAKKITLYRDVDPRIQTVVVDEEKFIRILRELLDNAIKFSPPEESVVLRIREQGGALICTVEDHGPGLSEEAQKHLFEPFWQAERGSDRGYSGFGIGLALVQRYIQLHDGQMWVESEEGKGSTFAFVLPGAVVLEGGNAGDSERGPRAHPSGR